VDTPDLPRTQSGATERHDLAVKRPGTRVAMAEAMRSMILLLLVCLLSSFLVAIATLGAVACSGGSLDSSRGSATGPSGPGDGAYGGSFPAMGAPAMDDADVSAVVSTDSPPNGDAEEQDEQDEQSDAGAQRDPTPDGACARPLAPGDLRIDELMIASVAGSGDDGEWLEIASTLDCAANLNGVHGECPRGAKVSTFDVTGDVWLPPRGAFVVADSIDPAINHALPGLVVAWFGHPGDVLRNQGSTITISLDGTLLDTITYPSLSLAIGTSVAFPSDCDASTRGDFTRWKRSATSWFPGFLGTPNAPNTDIHCP
jgi:hypothetical protein